MVSLAQSEASTLHHLEDHTKNISHMSDLTGPLLSAHPSRRSWIFAPWGVGPTAPGPIEVERSQLQTLIVEREALGAEGQRLGAAPVDYRDALQRNRRAQYDLHWALLAQTLVVAAVVTADLPNDDRDLAEEVLTELSAYGHQRRECLLIDPRLPALPGWLDSTWQQAGKPRLRLLVNLNRSHAQAWLARLAVDPQAMPDPQLKPVVNL